MIKSPYFTEEHEMLRDLVQRFVAEKVAPDAQAWEAAGMTPQIGRAHV